MIEHKSPEDLTVEDLRQLIEQGYAEGKTIEYKRDRPGNTDSDKRECASDVTSLANTGGGYLLYGLEAAAGIPSALVGICDVSGDDLKLHISNVLQANVQPRLSGVGMAAVGLPDGGFVLAVHVPASWRAPHAVKVNDALRFSARNSAGKYHLDMEEVRALVTLTESMTERLAHFRAARLSAIADGRTPIPMMSGAKVALHFVPLRGLASGAPRIDSRRVEEQSVISILHTLNGGFTRWRHNVDGVLTFSEAGQERAHKGRAKSYLQVFRNGALEYVDGFCVQANDERSSYIPTAVFEQYVLRGAAQAGAVLRALDIDPPIAIMLSLLHVNGFTLAGPEGERGEPIGRAQVEPPEILIESLEYEATQLMKPMLDIVWNAGGWAASPNYDPDTGAYIGRYPAR